MTSESSPPRMPACKPRYKHANKALPDGCGPGRSGKHSKSRSGKTFEEKKVSVTGLRSGSKKGVFSTLTP